MSPTGIRDVAALLEALDGRGEDPAAQARFDAELWAARGAHAAMLVTDLSGFTRVTRARGIIHFLAMFRRAQRALEPVILAHGGVLVKHEADDLIARFPDATSAVHAGVAMLASVRAMEAGRPEGDRIGLCIGVEEGRVLLLDDDAFGDAVNVAYKLGEELARPGEVLVGPEAWRSLSAAGATLRGCAVGGPRAVEVGGVALEHHALTLA
jgi:adenylate cyclase